LHKIEHTAVKIVRGTENIQWYYPNFGKK